MEIHPRRGQQRNRLNCPFMQIGREVEEVKKGSFTEAFGVDEHGAVLIRPDGFIAWREASKAVDPQTCLENALK